MLPRKPLKSNPLTKLFTTGNGMIRDYHPKIFSFETGTNLARIVLKQSLKSNQK